MSEQTTLIQDFHELIVLMRGHGMKFRDQSPFGGHALVAFKTKEFEVIKTTFTDHLKAMKMIYELLHDHELNSLVAKAESAMYELFSKFKKFLWVYSMEFDEYFLVLQKMDNIRKNILDKLHDLNMWNRNFISD